jgi:hypothetical protein
MAKYEGGDFISAVVEEFAIPRHEFLRALGQNRRREVTTIEEVVKLLRDEKGEEERYYLSRRWGELALEQVEGAMTPREAWLAREACPPGSDAELVALEKLQTLCLEAIPQAESVTEIEEIIELSPTDPIIRRRGKERQIDLAETWEELIAIYCKLGSYSDSLRDTLLIKLLQMSMSREEVVSGD